MNNFIHSVIRKYFIIWCSVICCLDTTVVKYLKIFYIYFSVYSAVFIFRCCRLLWVSWFSFMFTHVRHSFSSLIHKQLSRKATLMFQDVLLVELFQRTLPNPFLFSFKSTKKCSRQNLQVRKKAYCPLTALGEDNTLFFWTSQQPISVHHDLKISSAV